MEKTTDRNTNSSSFVGILWWLVSIFFSPTVAPFLFLSYFGALGHTALPTILSCFFLWNQEESINKETHCAAVSCAACCTPWKHRGFSLYSNQSRCFHPIKQRSRIRTSSSSWISYRTKEQILSFLEKDNTWGTHNNRWVLKSPTSTWKIKRRKRTGWTANHDGHLVLWFQFDGKSKRITPFLISF